MRSIVTGAEMLGFDELAMATTPHEVLVDRAGMAVATEVRTLLGDVRGCRIIVVAGPGSNGADGRVAGRRLAALGAVVSVLEPQCTTDDLAEADVVIDAAFGTGASRPYVAPTPPPQALVVAVDLPSGLDATTGEALGSPMAADVTVTMAAPKVGLVLGDGPRLAGQTVVADIGIPTDGSSMALLTEDDLQDLPARSADAHKWSAAVCIVAGAAGMEGAAVLSSLGAMRAGAGMVRLVHPVDGSSGSVVWPVEVVRHPTSPADLAEVARSEAIRASAMIVGPGLGRTEVVHRAVRSLVEQRTIPVILDADGLAAVGDLASLSALVAAAEPPVVITPHHGELVRLCGGDHEVSAHLATVEHVAQTTGAIVLAKGPTTVVADPTGAAPSVRLVTSGTSSLATAGTGDVLSGVIAAFVAQGVPAPSAAALGALVHGLGGQRSTGTLLASDLPALIGDVLFEVRHGS